MKTFQQRKQEAQRRALDVLPEERRPALTLAGARRKECGECQACCFIQRIDAVDKPPYTMCQHQCLAGCAVHASKPAECAHYECGYLLGALVGGEEMRPDSIGLVVDFRPALDRDNVEYGDDEVLIALWEVRPDAALSERGWLLIRRLLQLRQNMILVPFDSTPTADGKRIDHVRLYTSESSRAPHGLFNRAEPTREAVEEVLRGF